MLKKSVTVRDSRDIYSRDDTRYDTTIGVRAKCVADRINRDIQSANLGKVDVARINPEYNDYRI